MKRLLAIAVAIAAVTMMAETDANAQGYGQGYQFGAGINNVYGGGFSRGFQREQPPYFAKFPPVYYSHIVKRPYGVSPYAAPAGIAPVELNSIQVVPVTVKNPFYNNQVTPVKAPTAEDVKSVEKVTWISNPYLDPVVIR